MSAQGRRPGGKELRKQALDRVVTDRGTPYQITDKDLEDLLVHPQQHAGLFVSEMQATKEIYNHNNLEREPTSHEVAAIARVHAALSIENWHPDVAIKTFHDLDTIFFNGRLRGNVCICWCDGRKRYQVSTQDLSNMINSNRMKSLDEPLASGQNKAIIVSLGVTYCDGYPPGQCRIKLNAGSILPKGKPGSLSSWAQMWAVLMHEMCHAYDRVRTADAGGHGKHFGTKLEAVARRWDKLFGFPLDGLRYEVFQASELSDNCGEVVDAGTG